MENLVDDAKKVSSRLMCLDVYRGLMVAGMIVVDNPGSDEHAYWPIMHAKWNGWTPADFIFPSFLFLVGISMVYSYAARLERGETKQQIFAHAIKAQSDSDRDWVVGKRIADHRPRFAHLTI